MVFLAGLITVYKDNCTLFIIAPKNRAGMTDM